MTAKLMMIAAGLLAAGCSNVSTSTEATQNELADGNGVSLRNLTDTEVATVPQNRDFRIKGTAIPTPSDTRSTYYLLRERRAVGGNIVAILREERGDRVAYARTEIDCANRLFHVLGVGPSRASAEIRIAHDGPLRPMTGLPLREELGGYICERAGTPLKA